MDEESIVVRIAKKRFSYRCKAIASVAVCALGAISMYVSDGQTGVGWGIFGLWFIWSK